jgi:HemY protein
MIRVLVLLAVLALLAAGLGWLADRPGVVELAWQGWQVRTSVLALAVALLVVAFALTLIIAVLRAVVRVPGSLANVFRTRRRSRGFNAVTQGMIAVGSGDVRKAQRQAVEAERILGGEPLALLLRAQAAQLSGDRAAAESAFTAMLEDPETKPLGLRGLFVEARRRGDATAARALAAEATRTSPALPWAGTALLEFQSIEKDWDGALATLARNAENRLIDRDTAKRHRAVLLTARAIELAERDRTAAKASVLEAVKLAPGLVPAAVLAARLLSDGNEIRRAARIIEAAWRLSPHPDLADAYMGVRPGDSARDRLQRMQTLAALNAQGPESGIALARAALSARDFPLARGSLAPILATGASERVYLLMAEIEEAEHGATGRVREWLARAVRAPRDPAWTADGLVSDDWLPVSPVTGRIDAFEWRMPVERLGGPALETTDDVLADVDEPAMLENPALIETRPAEPEPVSEAAPSADRPSPPPEAAVTVQQAEEPKATSAPTPPLAPAVVEAPAPAPAHVSPIAPPAPAQPVRPTQAYEPIVATPPTPDDPGPETEEPAKRRFPLFG